MLGRRTSCGIDSLKSHLPHGFSNWTASSIPLCLIANIDKESAHHSFDGKSKQVLSRARDSVQMSFCVEAVSISSSLRKQWEGSQAFPGSRLAVVGCLSSERFSCKDSKGSSLNKGGFAAIHRAGHCSLQFSQSERRLTKHLAPGLLLCFIVAPSFSYHHVHLQCMK